MFFFRKKRRSADVESHSLPVSSSSPVSLAPLSKFKEKFHRWINPSFSQDLTSAQLGTSCAGTPSLEIFVRHCHYSAVSAHKNRFEGFSKQLCFENFIGTLDRSYVNVTFFLDTYYPMEEPHFVSLQEVFPVIEIEEGTEAGSFLRLLDYVERQQYDPSTILYFLEDDYLHQPGWIDALLEAFTLPGVQYVTLYDHRDKYFDPLYLDLTSKIYHTQTCHWRSTPSTTNTYAMRASTLYDQIELHRRFSQGVSISKDHEKFLALKKEKGAQLISSIPGFSTHAEPQYASPCVDWSVCFSRNSVS